MENNHEIDQIMNNYKESLPPVVHTKGEENRMMSNIIHESTTRDSEKVNIKDFFFGVIEATKNLFNRRNKYYSLAGALSTILIAGALILNYNTTTTLSPSLDLSTNKSNKVDKDITTKITPNSDRQNSNINVPTLPNDKTEILDFDKHLALSQDNNLDSCFLYALKTLKEAKINIESIEKSKASTVWLGLKSQSQYFVESQMVISKEGSKKIILQIKYRSSKAKSSQSIDNPFENIIKKINDYKQKLDKK